MDASEILIEVTGWAAALLILGAHVLLSLGKPAARGLLYQWLNVIGAGGGSGRRPISAQ